jgi:hypothetical protein
MGRFGEEKSEPLLISAGFGSDEVEAKVADLENRYALLLEALRTEPINAVPKLKIDEFVSHLLVRTNNSEVG